MAASNVLPFRKKPRSAAAEERAADDEALVQGLRDAAPWAERALVERYSGHLERILTRILGPRAEIEDLVQETLVRAFERVGEIAEPRALRGWLAAIAVFVAREAIRRKRRKRWLFFLPPEETPELEIPHGAPEARAALVAFYAVMHDIDGDLRIPFTLRFVEGMELTEVADACGVSLATIKRRLKDAEGEFLKRARRSEALDEFLEEGTRWSREKT